MTTKAVREMSNEDVAYAKPLRHKFGKVWGGDKCAVCHREVKHGDTYITDPYNNREYHLQHAPKVIRTIKERKAFIDGELAEERRRWGMDLEEHSHFIETPHLLPKSKKTKKEREAFA